MVRINTLLEDAIFKLANNIGDSTDWEIVYYEYYIDLLDEDMKHNMGKLLIDTNLINLNDEQREKISILKNVIEANLGISRVMK